MLATTAFAISGGDIYYGSLYMVQEVAIHMLILVESIIVSNTAAACMLDHMLLAC